MQSLSLKSSSEVVETELHVTFSGVSRARQVHNGSPGKEVTPPAWTRCRKSPREEGLRPQPQRNRRRKRATRRLREQGQADRKGDVI